MLGEGAGLIWFSTTQSAAAALTAMITFGLFTHMACGSTYVLVPFLDRKCLGGVAGIVGVGGNVGAVAAGYLLKATGNVQRCFATLGASAIASAFCALAVRFSEEQKARERELYEAALHERRTTEPYVRVMPAA